MQSVAIIVVSIMALIITLLIGALALFLAFFLGFITLLIQCVSINAGENIIHSYYGREVVISGTITQNITKKNDTYRITLDDIHINYSIKACKSQVYVMMSDLPESLSRSDNIVLNGKLSEGFGDYGGFLYKPQLIAFSKPSPPDLANEIKTKFASALRLAVNNEERSNLALGYLVGEKGHMSEEFNEQLKRVGMSHAVVASGFHLAVFINFAKKYFKKLSRLFALFGALIFLSIFISIAGFSPSLVRAGLVTILSLFAWYFGRRFHPGRIILYTASLSLIINPSYISNLA